MKSPQPHTQHLKEIERGDDKKKQKKWDKQKAQNQMVEISWNILELTSTVKRQWLPIGEKTKWFALYAVSKSTSQT